MYLQLVILVLQIKLILAAKPFFSLSVSFFSFVIFYYGVSIYTKCK